MLDPAGSSPAASTRCCSASSDVYREIYEHGLVERTFVQLDPDGAPIEKEGVGVRAASYGSHIRPAASCSGGLRPARDRCARVAG